MPDRLGRRLFVSRANAAGRRVENEATIMAILGPLGYESVRNETLTIPETIATYRQAEFVIGPMGSSMCSTLFCEPNAKIIELYPDSSVNVFTWAFGQFLGQRFGYLTGVTQPDQSQNPHNWNYTIDPSKLQALMNQMENWHPSASPGE